MENVGAVIACQQPRPLHPLRGLHHPTRRVTLEGMTCTVSSTFIRGTRYGDVHAWTEEFARFYGFRIQIIPLDIIYAHPLCNMMLSTTRDFWQKQISDGRLLGVILAPPCESWSVARWRAVHLKDGGPAPIRTLAHPWGAPNARFSQLHQVEVATDLLMVALLFAMVATRFGLSFVLEHPAEPMAVPLAASIWRLGIVKEILAMKNIRLHRILQGYFGAPSAKPTFFMAHALPALDVTFSFWGHQYFPGRPWITLAGKGDDNQWLTTKAKAYPSRLNAALVEAFYQRAAYLRSLSMEEQAPWDKAFEDAVQAIRTAMESSGMDMGADFAQ